MIQKPKPTPVVGGTMASPAAFEGIPLDITYQGVLLKLLIDDRELSSGIGEHISPHYFQNPVHAWAWSTAQKFREQFWAYPTLSYLENLAAQLEPGTRDVYVSTVSQLRAQPVLDEQAVRYAAVEFVRRAVFRQAMMDARELFNAGKFGPAYDMMQERMDKLRAISVEPQRRSWIAEGLIDRHVLRQDAMMQGRAVTTGIPELDKVLEDGLRPGELGLWIAYPKMGKTSMLISFALTASRVAWKKSLFCVLEGNLWYVENRFDAMLFDEQYSAVKRGDVDPAKYAKAVAEVQYLRSLLCVKDFTAKGWEVTVSHIDAELKELRRSFGFVPDLVVVDYVDLMRARTQQETEQQHQKQSVQDLKNLSGRGPYAIWSACQAQRPKGQDFKVTQEVLMSNQIADCYAKVRIADFVGSLNQTEEEKAQGVMRLYPELYRDGPAGVGTILIAADFSRMKFGSLSGAAASMPGAKQVPASAAVQVTKPFYPNTKTWKQKTNGV